MRSQITIVGILVVLDQANSFLQTDSLNLDRFLKIYKKHFILVRRFNFLVLQDDEHQTELNQISKNVIKTFDVPVLVREKFLSKNSTSSDLPILFHSENVSTNTHQVFSHKEFVRIKSLSSDSTQGYVVLVWSIEIFLKFLKEDFKIIIKNVRANYLILFVSSDCSTFDVDLKTTLAYLWSWYGVSNVIAQPLYPCSEPRIYTYHPFVTPVANNWGVSQSYTIEEIFSNFMLITNSFLNCNQFPIRVGFFERKPTAVTEIAKLLQFNPIYQNLTLSAGFGGLDGCLLRALSEKLNFHAQVDVIHQSYGRAYPNGTFTETLGQLVNHQLHYSANGWFLTDYQTDEIELAFPYSFDQVCAVAPKARKIPPWKSLLYCFDFLSWLLIFSLSVCCALFWSFLNLDKSLTKSLFEIYSILFGNPARIVPHSNQYFFLASCLTFSIIIMGIIQGSFFTDFTTVVFYKDINTLEDLDKSGLSIATSTWYLDYDTSELMKNLKKKQVEKTHDSFADAAYKRNVAVLYRKQDVEYLVNIKFLGQEGLPLLHIVRECLHSFLIVNVHLKGFPFYFAFNEVIMKLVESGLTSKWYNDEIDALVLQNLIELGNLKSEHNCRLKDVQLAFYVLAFGEVLSIIVFFYEIRKDKRKWTEVLDKQ